MSSKVGKYSVSVFDPGVKSKTETKVDPDLLALVQESWEQREADTKRGPGFAVPIAELDPAQQDYDRAVRVVRQAGAALGVGIYARHVTDEDGVECVGFAAQVKREVHRG